MPSLLNAVRDLGRLRQIYVVLVRHGFADVASRLGLGSLGRGEPRAKPEAEQPPAAADETTGVELVERERGERERTRISTAERVRLVAMDLGPSFVKLGQIASTRPDLLPEQWVTELAKLQDEVTPVAFAQVREVVETSLGSPLDQLFEQFDQVPLAAASIAQAHRAKLRVGDGAVEVVVKVQRPGVADVVARDVEILQVLARLVERTMPESRTFHPTALVDEFDRAISAELDFRQEADHAERFARNFAGSTDARFPKIYREASAKQVLTMEYLSGHKLTGAVLELGFDGRAIARTAAGIVIKMIFEDGFFHADPHPGNVLLMGEPAAPCIGLVDLGMVGRLSPEMRDRTVDLIMAAIGRDHSAMADALLKIGTPTKQVDMAAFRAEVERLSDIHLRGSLKEISFARLVTDLVAGATRFGLEIPSDFLLVGKALMTLEGTAKQIDPELDVMTEARPFFVELLRKRYSPDRIAADAWRGLQRLSGTAVELPQQLRTLLEEMRAGRLVVKAPDAPSAVALERLGRRLSFALLAASCTVGGSWLLAASERHQTLAFVLLGVAAFWIAWLIVVDRTRREG